MSSDRQRVVFLHIPKTGGMSLYDVLRRNYAGLPAYVQFETRSAGEHALFERPQHERDSLAYVAGHVHYGIHAIWSEPAAYFTMLRDPVDRLISQYYYVTTSRDHRNYEKRSAVTFSEFALEERHGSYVARRLAGYADPVNHVPFKPGELSASEMIDLAVANLKRHAVVGLTSEFDTSLLLLRRAFGWKRLYYVRRNTTKQVHERSEISADLKAELRGHLAVDGAIVEAGRALFDAACASYGPDLERDLAAFQRSNTIYGNVARAVDRIRSDRLKRVLRRLFWL
ncbi:MAG: sulfotransferase family 2 domain-containing protein [Chloroflexi bacterium]|nr:sulfotransferase family 2 domain-containing protein [Chloroflexota bacterium]